MASQSTFHFENTVTALRRMRATCGDSHFRFAFCLRSPRSLKIWHDSEAKERIIGSYIPKKATKNQGERIEKRERKRLQQIGTATDDYYTFQERAGDSAARGDIEDGIVEKKEVSVALPRML